MDEKEKCSNCDKDMEFIKVQIVSNTKYKIFKCTKCNRQVAKSD